MGKTHILGIPVDALSPAELGRAIRRLLEQRRGHIVTPNPEFLLLAQQNQEFFSVLEEANLSIPDGIGLKFACWVRGVNLRRYSGSNLVSYFLKIADKMHLRVAVINWSKGLSSDEEIIRAIKRRHSRLKVLVISMERGSSQYDVARLRTFHPDIAFVTLGAPWQDIFIRRRLLRDIQSLRFAMGVGGSFDFLTRRIRRAPRAIQFFGFEWLWRLIQQPWRFKRIYNAVVVFPLAVIGWQFRRFKYRPNVVAMIVNKQGEVLLLNAAGRRTYWGLPQGGVEKRETLEKAVRREIQEETGLTKLRIQAVFPNTFQYDWPKHYTAHGYKGQRQSFFIMEYDGPRNSVRTNPIEHKSYRWVKLEHLIQASSAVHRKQYQIFLDKYYEIKNKK